MLHVLYAIYVCVYIVFLSANLTLTNQEVKKIVKELDIQLLKNDQFRNPFTIIPERIFS